MLLRCSANVSAELPVAAAGETRLHSSVPFLLGSVALLSMAFFLDHNPSAAFVSLLGATVIWGSGGGCLWPASELSLSKPHTREIAISTLKLFCFIVSWRSCWQV